MDVGENTKVDYVDDFFPGYRFSPLAALNSTNSNDSRSTDYIPLEEVISLLDSTLPIPPDVQKYKQKVIKAHTKSNGVLSTFKSPREITAMKQQIGIQNEMVKLMENQSYLVELMSSTDQEMVTSMVP